MERSYVSGSMGNESVVLSAKRRATSAWAHIPAVRLKSTINVPIRTTRHVRAPTRTLALGFW
ncbi:MAG: hypothetical protein L0I80_13110 [Brevibacterium sp.]|uniref:hypothetical protein n=1 Tax=Brevibacterium sp. TaxID=1701 RepID=UPI00264705EE|nr:hypothetical protein [Brevibacterium sp.]MDN5807584.1 hypothetical protein [Brevibacterium sp.]MDN5833190.1 hypothetical protein [Brevibacterium sp.]MDN5875704.1 hypothetical protein [Brevibacterium sp.]MDN5909540.1 hypothetical protein [Brevibacterium sp.]MDN6124786.1 hypothetical protein [Brevibacterium sp.]